MHAAIDANKSGGIPLGGWTSFENDTAPNDEWLQAGTTFDSDTYPELFLYLGGNTVPQMFDHSRLNETFDNTVDLSATTLENAYTCPYDGFIYWATNQISSTTNLRIYVNNTETFAWVQGSGTSEKQYGVLPVKKGDKVWHLGTATFEYHNARWYTHPLFIKATTTASSYTPSTAMQEIKDYTKDYVDAKNSYSTTETLTGGTWFDGKPIYKISFDIYSFSATEGVFDSAGTYDKIIHQEGWMRISSQIYPIEQGCSNSFTLRINANTHNLEYIRHSSVSSAGVTILYTKTTD